MHILIVDDDYSNRIAMQRLLESYGHAVVTADSGEKAVELFNVFTTLHVVITDFDMGAMRMNGVQLLKKLKALRKSIRVFLASGALEKHDQAEAIAAGAEAAVDKMQLSKHLREAGIMK